MVKQFEIYWVNLDPTKGSEINKTRPAVIITPDASNKALNTVIVAPLTSTIRNFLMGLNISLEGNDGQIALDQLRCVDKKRLLNKVGILNTKESNRLQQLIKEYLTE